MTNGGRRRVAWLLTLVGVVSLGLVANLPVTTKQGVNFEASLHRMPLYLKAFEFLDRNAQYRQLANEITRGAVSDQERALAVFNWTARRIQPAPGSWPVVDDHILNIIIRGYGQSDQRADVFATLATYAGVQAFWQQIKAAGTQNGVILTFVLLNGRWVVMDIANGFMFRNARGELASAEDFAANLVTLPAAARSLMLGPTPYSQIFSQLRTPPIPRPLRAELQMPWPRIWDQTKRAVGRERDDGSDDGFER
ncbi:MAG: transglutaminase domain-containing protein [Acidobacteria bacterium]|nr:transglutaminase domain-containing protein [Acidobacteriota bacterium]